MDKKKKIDLLRVTTKECGYDFSDSQLNELVDHVNTHEYFLGMEIYFPFTWDQAHFSWYERVFRPIDLIVANSKVVGFLTGLEKEDAFFHISQEWYFASTNLKYEVYAHEAARRMCRNLSQRGKLVTEILLKFIV